VVESADEAVSILAHFSPQVVVADYRLRSHRHGQEAIETVRRQARRKIPAVLVTGDTAADRIREAQASGVTLLHKPVPASQLHQVLADLIRSDVLNGGEAMDSPEPPASAAD
jgi:CheY-like chemotaxis protein